MPLEDIDPKTALQRQSEGARYIDVRAPEEFAAGHPTGAVNIPIAFATPTGMAPNPEFVSVVQRHFSPDTTLLLGCKSGGRSARALQALAAAGFTNLANVVGGFYGGPGAPGWSDLGLPSSTETEGVSYDDLK
ncbi:MAG: rhodanese-like domain-containing protein [Myxococcota bacterium]